MMKTPHFESNTSISRIKRFGIMLVSTRKVSNLLSKTGEAIQQLVPGAILLISKPMRSSLRLSWQSGMDPYLNKIYTNLHGDPMHMAFPLLKETSEQHASLRDNKLHHYKKGSYPQLHCALPERLFTVLDNVIGIHDISVIGFAWTKVHYATLIILLPEGVHFKNQDAIETDVLLASGALMRIEIENEIRQSETQYRTLVEESSEAIGVSRGNRVIYANPALLKMLGYDSLEDFAKAPLVNHIAPKSKGTVLSRMQRRDQNLQVPPVLTHEMIRKDGQIRNIRINSRDILFKGERCTQTSFHDITDLKPVAESSTTLNKLESFGMLTCGFAHEYNNVFMGLLGYIENAKSKIGNATAIRNLNQALEQLDRARELTSRLVTFSSGGIPDLQPRPLLPFAEEVVKTAIENSLYTCTSTRVPHLRNCFYDRSQLHRILLALIDNALDAMPSGGEIKLSAANDSLEEGNHAGLPAGDYVRFSISDQGAGIPGEILPRIFSPFFTTKPGGTGLSLAVALCILQRHGGTIQVTSTPGKGAAFHVYLRAELGKHRQK
jgi:PAS domain S-box-containing protein